MKQIYIPPEKDSKLWMIEDCFRHSIKMEEQKIINLPVYLIQHLIIYLNLLPVLIRFKTSILQSDLCDCRDAYIVFKEAITVSVVEIIIKIEKTDL